MWSDPTLRRRLVTLVVLTALLAACVTETVTTTTGQAATTTTTSRATSTTTTPASTTTPDPGTFLAVGNTCSLGWWDGEWRRGDDLPVSGGEEYQVVRLDEPITRTVGSEPRPSCDPLDLVSVEFERSIERPIVGITIRDRMGQEICATNSSFEDVPLPPAEAGDILTVAVSWTVPTLRPGSYSISPAVARGNIWEHEIEDWIDNAYIVNIVETGLVYGLMKVPFEVGFRRFGS